MRKVRACKSILLMVSRMPQDEMVCVGWDDRELERGELKLKIQSVLELRNSVSVKLRIYFIWLIKLK